MSDYKLTYFEGMGLAELIRLIFAAAEVQYEDVRTEYGGKEWESVKPTTPYGVLPMLETGGETYFQSVAIARHLARKFGLAGTTELEQFKADIVVDTIEDICKPVSAFYRLETSDKPKYDELRNTYIEETVPKFLGVLEKLLKTNSNGDGYFVGDSLTWADLHFIGFVDRIELLVKFKIPLENFPKLKSLHERVKSLPRISAWIEKRPGSWF